MPIKIEVKGYDEAVKATRQAVAQRVLDEFGNGLPALRLLAFFDDQDWQGFREELGHTNRGVHFPVKPDSRFPNWPQYLYRLVSVWPEPNGYLDLNDPESWRPVKAFDSVIYLYDSTCAGEVGQVMTFSHELQHFVQYGFSRKL